MGGSDQCRPEPSRRDPGGVAGRRRDRCPARRHPGTLRLSQADRVVGRTRRDPVPVARHAGLGHRLPARRTHAHDGDRRHARARARGRSSTWSRSRPPWPFSARDPPGLRVRRGRGLRHHPGARDRERLARRRAAGWHRADAGGRVLRLASVGNWRHVLGAVALVAPSIGRPRPARARAEALGNLNLLIFFVGLVGAMVFAAVPIAFAFGLATFGYIALTTTHPDVVVVGRMDEGMSHLILLAVPLFVFLGLLIEMTGMARAMVGFLASLLGHVRGGLHYVLVGAMYLVSGISGSKAADMAAVAPVLFPEMKERGAKPGDLVALLSATGAQTETIPPSPRADHHRLGHGRVDRGPVHRRASARHRARRSRSAPWCGGATAARTSPRDARDVARDRLGVPHRDAGDRLAVRDPGRGDRGGRDRDRGLDHRHRLLGPGRPADLPPVRLAAALPDAGRDGGAVGRDPAHHRRGDRDGLGADAVGLLGLAGRVHDRPARAACRRSWPSPIVAFVILGSRAGGHSGDRAVRAAAVPDRQAGRRARGALRDGGDPGDGHRPVRAALRGRLLRGLRDQPHPSGRGHEADRRLHAGPAHRHDHRRRRALDLHRVPLKG